MTGNTFVLSGGTALFAKSTGGLTFTGNTIECPYAGDGPLFVPEECSDITIDGNRTGKGCADKGGRCGSDKSVRR